jgi:integrase/recombinase XerD
MGASTDAEASPRFPSLVEPPQTGDPTVFETLFKYPRVVAWHRSGPFAEARERFLNHCVSQGLSGTTVVRHARELLVIPERIDITIGETSGAAVIEAAADRCAREQHGRRRVKVLQWSRISFVQTATNWLRFLGRLEESRAKTLPFADRRANFAAYQHSERGLSAVTIRGQSWHVEKFLSRLGEQNRSFGDVCLEDVDAFLASNGKRGWGRRSVSTSVQALRTFFRHAAAKGIAI